MNLSECRPFDLRLAGVLSRCPPPQIALALRAQPETVHPQPQLSSRDPLACSGALLAIYVDVARGELVNEPRELHSRRHLRRTELGARRILTPRLPQCRSPRMPLTPLVELRQNRRRH